MNQKCYGYSSQPPVIHQVLYCTIHRKSGLKHSIKKVIVIHDSDARSSCKVIAALITPIYAIVLSLGRSYGGAMEQTHERNIFYYILFRKFAGGGVGFAKLLMQSRLSTGAQTTP